MSEQRIMRDTKVCFVIQKLALRSGGAERVLIDTANALYDRGYAVELVSHEHRGKKPFYPLRKGIIHTNLYPRDKNRTRIERLWARLQSVFHKNRLYLPGLAHIQWWSEHGAFRRRLARHIDATEPDVVIAFLPPAVTALGHAKPKYKPRRFASLHNVPEQDFDNTERWDPNPVDRRLRKSALEHFDGIGTLLPEFCDWFDPAMRDRLLIMPNAVKPVPVEKIAKAKRMKKVISVGRLADVKRHHLLIEAWADLQKEFPDWSCDIYGVGPIEAQLAQQIKELGLSEKVHLRGHSKSMEGVYLESAILAHPAKFEGFGLVITEALAHGLPVVGFEDCSGFNFIVRDRVSGVFVPAEGSRSANLAQALARLMRDPEERARLSQAGLEELERFREDNVLDLWEEAIHGKKTQAEV